jgi:diguanylate cyclase (GGDEF)-like protein
MTDSKKLFAGVLLFIVLDLSILLINYWITNQVSNDAVAINLAGRQRMLSQRITKSLLVLQPGPSNADRVSTIQELRDSVRMFDQTLAAFEHGGKAVGGDGKPVVLHRVDQVPAAALVSRAQQIWKPTRELLLPYLATRTLIPAEVLNQSQAAMLRNNLELLDLMNRLTSILEHNSLSRTNTLRIVQTLVFFLALVNFLVIVRKFHLLALQAHQAKEHFSALAVRDPLTGLFNRREFEHNLKREIGAVGRRSQDKFAVVMLDLDGFKPINDKFGHKTGDLVLKTVAERVAHHARATDTVARIGGDEFVLICTTLRDEENAARFCERLLNSINEPILLETGEIRVGASIGIAFYPNQTRSEHDLMHMADDAMYEAKKAGRNRYVCFREN